MSLLESGSIDKMFNSLNQNFEEGIKEMMRLTEDK
jgi:hypothetical protein